MSCGSRGRTSAADPAVSNSERSAIPVVGQPDLSVREGTGSRICRDLQLDATERREACRIDARENVGDIDARVCGEVRRRREGNIRDVARRETRACRFRAARSRVPEGRGGAGEECES